MKFFNTAGPIVSEDHYALDPLTRIDFDELIALIDQKKYFVLHAPRQTGKTSLLLALMAEINRVGRYRCLYVNVEAGQTAREDVGAAMAAILSMLAFHAREHLEDDFFEKNRPTRHERESPHTLLATVLSAWSRASNKPAILLIDEIDALVGDTLVSVLRQLRTGYANRPNGFPQCIVLCGVRDVRDYRIHASSEKEPVSGGSAFNIKAKSLRMGNFTEAETRTLLNQHTEETGQVFTPEAQSAIWEASRGQPWLVNALAYEVTFEMKANRDRSVMITEDMVGLAREELIVRMDTHLDQLADKLREPRVHRVIAPILAGEDLSSDQAVEDISYVEDLGLIVSRPQISIANPIYREVIPRMLTWPLQSSLTRETHWYVAEETGRLDMAALLSAFQEFFREHSEHWIERFDYKEAGPQLLLQAFLQRVVNGGGRIEREYGLGRGRTDLLVIWPTENSTQKVVLELKIQRGSRETTIEKSLSQITSYMDRCGTSEGHLIIFDQSAKSWDDKIFSGETDYDGRTIQTWGM